MCSSCHTGGTAFWIDELKDVPLKKIILASLLTAIAVGTGYLFLYVPNVEMITATVFISGFIMGPLFGAIIGVLGEFLFSLFNPLGAPALPLLLAQVFAFGVTGFAGGLFQKIWSGKNTGVLISLYSAGCGLLVTLFYDILTTISFVFILTDATCKTIWVFFTSGMLFYLIHAAVNTAIFALIVPLLLYRLQPHIPAYLKQRA